MILFGFRDSRLHDTVGKVGTDNGLRQRSEFAAERLQFSQKLTIGFARGQVLFDLRTFTRREFVIEKCTKQFVWEFACHNNQPCRYY